jgi:rusticyanin
MRLYSVCSTTAALMLVGVAALSAQQPAPASSGLVRVVSTHARTFANEDALPKAIGSPTIDRAANRVTLHAGDALTVMAGPESNMMSYNIAGLANPEIVIPRGARVTLTIVNVDDDMNHDFEVSAKGPPYAAVPALGADAVGTEALAPHKGKQPISATELVLEGGRAGKGFYLCTVKGHAKDGMFGKLTVAP